MKREKEMTTQEIENLRLSTYFVANCKGELLGHDLSFTTAQDCLAEALLQDPQNSEEWEIISDTK